MVRNGTAAAGCAYGGHWAAYVPVGATLQVRVVLPAAEAARCATVAVNGGPSQPVVVAPDGSVVVEGPAVALGGLRGGSHGKAATTKEAVAGIWWQLAEPL